MALDIVRSIVYNNFNRNIYYGAEAGRMNFMTVKEAAGKWGISERRVHKLCKDDRIEGQMRFAAVWMIPADAAKPIDARIKSGKYTGKNRNKEKHKDNKSE